jgi:hypothetical protein
MQASTKSQTTPDKVLLNSSAYVCMTMRSALNLAFNTTAHASWAASHMGSRLVLCCTSNASLPLLMSDVTCFFKVHPTSTPLLRPGPWTTLAGRLVMTQQPSLIRSACNRPALRTLLAGAVACLGGTPATADYSSALALAEGCI